MLNEVLPRSQSQAERNKTDEKKKTFESTNRSAELFRNTLERHYGIILSDTEEKKMADILLRFSYLPQGGDPENSMAEILALMKSKFYK